MPVSSEVESFRELESPSAESEVFLGQFETILESVQLKLVRTCEELFTAGLIDNSECEQLVDDRRYGTDERANQLLRIVEWRIREDGTRFYLFLEVLTVLELSDLASQLKRILDDYQRKYKLLVDHHLFLVGAFESRISEVPRELFRYKKTTVKGRQDNGKG